MTPDRPLTDAQRSRLLRRSAWGWVAFWLMMYLVGVQEQSRNGVWRFWPPLVDYGTAALAATALALLQIRRAKRLQTLLDQPLRWFLALWAPLPLVAAGYIAGMIGLRWLVHTLAGEPYRHDPWGEMLVYETIKFLIFYALFSGVHFGVRSFLEWNAERLRSEQQLRLAQQAQLAQLTQQLQPHFLFNALNTISSLIHSDPDLADALLTRLATLLRAATEASRRPEQPLADELALLEAYAEIMIQRFADRASVQWEIDAAARACNVPTLGLQPLLENCFRHVVEKRRAATRIVVRAHCSPRALSIEIEDDGDTPRAPPVYGIGLGNLDQRLRSLHGERARLSLLPREGGGSIARLELPCEC